LNPGGIGTKIRLYYNSQLQFYEHFPYRGFQSSVDPEIHFGLGPVTVIDSLSILWPDGKIQSFNQVPADRLLTLNYEEASFYGESPANTAEPLKLFREISGETGINYYHREREFVDFMIQPLVPHLFSKEGPGISVGDVNSDGLDDFFIGGSTGYFGAIFSQQKNGKFTSIPLHDNPNYEDMGSLLFDADMDGDNDLYVVSGGTGIPPGNQFYADRFYVNEGDGVFSRSDKALPDSRVSGSQVSAADFDRDGDLDLFVCGRVKLENYPYPDRSFLLRNDSRGENAIHFTDITMDTAEGLAKIGLVSSALWTDFDQDGWIDLILAGEWMPITMYKNIEGKLVDITPNSGLAEYTGWWNSLTGADFDRDGDIDYIAGNHGLNSRYKVSQEQPMQVIAKDFDKNGIIDPVCTYYVQGQQYPIYHRNIMIDQIPLLRMRYEHYEDYARATFDDIFSEDQLEGAYSADSRYFNSAFIENHGDGTFNVRSLPLETQFGPVFGLLADDYNADGNFDILLIGNSYSFNVQDGQYDALIGLYLEGDGKGNFQPVPGRESGFFVDGDAKGMAGLTMSDGRSLILAAQNSGALKVYEAGIPAEKTVRLQPEDVSAVISYDHGGKEFREFYYGSGYLSNSSRICKIPPQVKSITISSFTGEKRTLTF
jgi:hypothetical protein